MKSIRLYKRIVFSVFFIAMLLSLFSACGRQDEDKSSDDTIDVTEDNTIYLWVLTEETVWDKMNYQAEYLITQFKRSHDDVEIELDILPTEQEERATYLEGLRTQIMAGGGPDIYLLPTSDTLQIQEGIMLLSKKVEPLFTDVGMAMHNGLFLDISEYYDRDTSLEKDRLVTAVMDAGIVGDARYVLPLRYDIPVVFADTKKLEASGMDLNAITSGILGLYEEAIKTGDQLWACGAECTVSEFSLFPNVIDYQNGEVTLSEEDLSGFLQLHQSIKSLVGSKFWHRGGIGINDYIHLDVSREMFEFPMHVGTLTNALDYAAIAKAEETELTMFPLRGTDGSLTADITYFGAVGSGCAHPELAYEYLRMFLLEESQWGESRPDEDPATVTSGLVGPGWPVLTDGSVEPLWDMIRRQYLYAPEDGDGRRPRKRKILGTKLTEADIPVLEAEIDLTRFPVNELDYSFAMTRSRVSEGSDFSAEAADLIQKLQWHVAEG